MNEVIIKDNDISKSKNINRFDEYKNMFTILFLPVFFTFLFYFCHLGEIKYSNMIPGSYSFDFKDLFTINGNLISGLKILTIIFLGFAYSTSINLLVRYEYKNTFYNWLHLKLLNLRTIKPSKELSVFINFFSFGFFISAFFICVFNLYFQSLFVSSYDYNLIPNGQNNFLPFISFYIWSGVIINLFIKIKFDIKPHKETSVAVFSSILSFVLFVNITDFNEIFSNINSSDEFNFYNFQYSLSEYAFFLVFIFLVSYLTIMALLKPCVNFINKLDEKQSKKDSFLGIKIKVEENKDTKPIVITYSPISYFSVIPFSAILLIFSFLPVYLVKGDSKLEQSIEINGGLTYYMNNIITHPSNTPTTEEHIELYLGKALINEDIILSLYSTVKKEGRVDEYITLLTDLMIQNQEMKIKNKDWIMKAEPSKYDNFSNFFSIKINQTLIKSVDNEKTIEILNMIKEKRYNEAYSLYNIHSKENIEEGDKMVATYLLECLFLFLDDSNKITLKNDDLINSKYNSLEKVEKNENKSNIEDLDILQVIFYR